ncbi:MAG: hypothetical protein QOG48_122 [Verrucomicrobiota bacterium]|jgi:hypothetical protein
MDLSGQLRAVETKIARVLAAKPECFITHLAELRVLKQLSADDLRGFAQKNGWQTVRRLGGRQIEFYNDVTVRPDQAARYQ